MFVNASNNISNSFNKKMHSLIEPDMGEYWAIRYVWIQHATNNNQFLNNYFNKENSNVPGLNVRKNTTHLQSYWDIHNKIFDFGRINGELIYRIKILNEIAESIDYIEVWKNTDLIKNYFMFDDDIVILGDGTQWTLNDKLNLSKGVFESGFISRNWFPPPTISRKCALDYYKIFVIKAMRNYKCVINTRFNSELLSSLLD